MYVGNVHFLYNSRQRAEARTENIVLSTTTAFLHFRHDISKNTCIEGGGDHHRRLCIHLLLDLVHE